MYICIRKFLDGMKHLFTLTLLGWLFCGCSGSEGFISQNNKEFAGTISDSEVQLVDVRIPEEFAAGHIPGAVNMDVKGGTLTTRQPHLKRNVRWRCTAEAEREARLQPNGLLSRGSLSTN